MNDISFENCIKCIVCIIVCSVSRVNFGYLGLK